ncbi:hypothetical protein ABZ922_34575 [Streptomyces shenzhenensis]|uniref:zinc finger domain-containing protein n=1 Tax=Streptomyces shenzhenensis TaxID=943815 RepID=UPI00341173BD
MTEEEAVQIAEYVAAACLAHKFGEYTPDVWGEILAPYDAAETRAAVIIAIARRRCSISPADIVTEIRERRAERIELANIVYDGNPLETATESAALREIIRAAGDGLTSPAASGRPLGAGDRLALPPSADHGPYEGRAAAARAAIGTMPSSGDRSSDPRARACRRCGAAPGTSCTTGGRRRRDVHPIRMEDTKREAAGLPLLDHDQAETRIKAASAAALAAHDEDQEQEAKAS